MDVPLHPQGWACKCPCRPGGSWYPNEDRKKTHKHTHFLPSVSPAALQVNMWCVGFLGSWDFQHWFWWGLAALSRKAEHHVAKTVTCFSTLLIPVVAATPVFNQSQRRSLTPTFLLELLLHHLLTPERDINRCLSLVSPVMTSYVVSIYLED